MPMHKRPIGKDSDGNTVNVIWGDDLNWAHGFVEGPQQQQREYYRAQGVGGAQYVVAREPSKGHFDFKYWYIVAHIDGQTITFPTECMNALEGQEICQIYESERDTRTRAQSLERTRARVEDKREKEDGS